MERKYMRTMDDNVKLAQLSRMALGLPPVGAAPAAPIAMCSHKGCNHPVGAFNFVLCSCSLSCESDAVYKRVCMQCVGQCSGAHSWGSKYSCASLMKRCSEPHCRRLLCRRCFQRRSQCAEHEVGEIMEDNSEVGRAKRAALGLGFPPNDADMDNSDNE